jgi:hypothetical protein
MLVLLVASVFVMHLSIATTSTSVILNVEYTKSRHCCLIGLDNIIYINAGIFSSKSSYYSSYKSCSRKERLNLN